MEVVLSIRQLQKNKGITNSEMAKMLGYSHTQGWLNAVRSHKFDIRKLPNFIRSFPEEKEIIEKILTTNITNTK